MFLAVQQRAPEIQTGNFLSPHHYHPKKNIKTFVVLNILHATLRHFKFLRLPSNEEPLRKEKWPFTSRRELLRHIHDQNKLLNSKTSNSELLNVVFFFPYSQDKP